MPIIAKAVCYHVACAICGTEWLTRGARLPGSCSRCGSRKWNEQRRRAPRGSRQAQRQERQAARLFQSAARE